MLTSPLTHCSHQRTVSRGCRWLPGQLFASRLAATICPPKETTLFEGAASLTQPC